MKMRNRSHQFLSFRGRRSGRGISPRSNFKKERFLASHGFRWSAACALGILAFLSGCSANNAAKPVSQPPDLSGIWQGKAIQSLSPSDPSGQKPGAEGDIPYTPWALAKMKAERPAFGKDQDFANTTDPALKYADPDGYPRASIHPMRFKIVQTPAAVYQLWEYNKSWRQIALNQPHSKVPDISWFGESVGKWEGDTLVVDSMGFNGSTWLDPVGHPHTEDLHMTERIRRVDPETLVFNFTFEDPKAYTKPWDASLTFKQVDDGIMTEIIYTISDELSFRQRFLNEKPPIPIRPSN
jgi:hypothetical protein